MRAVHIATHNRSQDNNNKQINKATHHSPRTAPPFSSSPMSTTSAASRTSASACAERGRISHSNASGIAMIPDANFADGGAAPSAPICIVASSDAHAIQTVSSATCRPGQILRST
jgi:hypothetical protein